ncbi:MAG TPA: hypothetical protein VGW09_01920 [Nitrososphaeraceae archaeon]|nr:hypothetical protein [Nitrososphaeraceae archaeon]
MYHCGADGLNGVWEHIANGMYGAIVVHPQNERPAKEFYMTFSELYNTIKSVSTAVVHKYTCFIGFYIPCL